MTSIEINKEIVTREAWLRAAIELFRPRFEEVGYPIPENYHVSVGFPFGAKGENKVIRAQCWATFASSDKRNHIFMSPIVADPALVLLILLHETIHMVLDCQDGHEGRFAEIATRLGFEGKLTTATAAPALAAEMMIISAELGEYPHGQLDPKPVTAPVGPDGSPIPGLVFHTGPKAQTNRHLKLTCETHPGFSVRTSRKMIEEYGFPSCPCGREMIWG